MNALERLDQFEREWGRYERDRKRDQGNEAPQYVDVRDSGSMKVDLFFVPEPVRQVVAGRLNAMIHTEVSTVHDEVLADMRRSAREEAKTTLERLDLDGDKAAS